MLGLLFVKRPFGRLQSAESATPLGYRLPSVSRLKVCGFCSFSTFANRQLSFELRFNTN